MDACRKISEFFKQQHLPNKSSSSPSPRPGSGGSSSKGKGVEPARDGQGQEVGQVVKRSVEMQTTLTASDLVELESMASSSHLTASLQQVHALLLFM